MKRLSVLFFVATILLSFMSNAFSQEDEILDIINGKIMSIDLSSNKLALQDIEGTTHEFILDPNLTTVWDDTADEEKELADLEKEMDVVVEFRVDKDGTKLASWIDIITTEEVVPEMEPAQAEEASTVQAE